MPKTKNTNDSIFLFLYNCQPLTVQTPDHSLSFSQFPIVSHLLARFSFPRTQFIYFPFCWLFLYATLKGLYSFSFSIVNFFKGIAKTRVTNSKLITCWIGYRFFSYLFIYSFSLSNSKLITCRIGRILVLLRL
jgi:hypothetical protein